MWVMLLIPTVEDGNNFGVSVQEGILAKIERVELEAINYLELISRYYVARGKLISKVCITFNILNYVLCGICVLKIS